MYLVQTTNERSSTSLRVRHAPTISATAGKDTAGTNTDNLPCLLLKHSHGWHNDRCEQWLNDHCYTTSTIVNQDGCHLPDVREYSRLIIYGGAPCINDVAHRERLQQEMSLIESALKNNIPCFGICLGAQLIAHVLGAEVKPLPCGTKELGYSCIKPTAYGKHFMPYPCRMLQWHCQGFDLPRDCELLATSEVFPNQAFRYKNTYGVQFHPEVTPDILNIWHRRAFNDARLALNKTQRHQQQIDCRKYAGENNRWFEHFMQLWVGYNENNLAIAS